MSYLAESRTRQLTEHLRPGTMAETTTTTTKHPLIGEVKGIVRTDESVEPHQGVRQYLGIQYATLKDRFAPAVLREYGGKTGVDATKIG